MSTSSNHAARPKKDDSRWLRAILDRPYPVTHVSFIHKEFFGAIRQPCLALSTESQAVQFSMLLLLGSIFFTGFILPLNQFASYIRYISYLLSITYRATGLQNTMLDTQPLNMFYLLVPFALGTLFLVAGRFLYRRQFTLG